MKKIRIISALLAVIMLITALSSTVFAADVVIEDYYKVKLKTIKTNFALEQLEKVKEKALHFYVNDAPELTSFYVDVKEIDSQIKSLKGEE